MGGDERILVRQTFLVPDYFGGLVGSGDRFLDGTLNSMKADATRQTSLLRNEAMPFVSEDKIMYTVEVYECPPYLISSASSQALAKSSRFKRTLLRHSH